MDNPHDYANKRTSTAQSKTPGTTIVDPCVDASLAKQHAQSFRNAIAALIALFALVAFIALVALLTPAAPLQPTRAWADDSLTAGAGDEPSPTTNADVVAKTPAKSVKYKKGKPRVLVSDTNPQSAANLVSYLRRCGCKVTVLGTRKINVKKFDGVALAGGPDVTPRLYGQKNKHSSNCNPAKDKMQIAVIKKFAKAGKPILGVCRGQQIINVAFGGTLKQHIGWHSGSRKVKIEKGSWLYKAYGKTAKVAHNHHQAIKKLGSGLVATQWDAKSKVIEAIEHETLPVYGVQWHPESMGKRGMKVGRIFKKECQLIRS